MAYRRFSIIALKYLLHELELGRIMPILVQWKWKEKTKSFLVIFHFFDDYSKPNLRVKKMRFEGSEPPYIYVPQDFSSTTGRSIKTRPVMTWAPSHVETGLLGELLRYANVVGGLNEAEKKKLRRKLEVIYDVPEKVEKRIKYNRHAYEKWKKEILDELSGIDMEFHLGCREIGKGGEVETVFCVELCSEYIEYLKKLLKPYLKD